MQWHKEMVRGFRDNAAYEGGRYLILALLAAVWPTVNGVLHVLWEKPWYWKLNGALIAITAILFIAAIRKFIQASQKPLPVRTQAKSHAGLADRIFLAVAILAVCCLAWGVWIALNKFRPVLHKQKTLLQTESGVPLAADMGTPVTPVPLPSPQAIPQPPIAVTNIAVLEPYEIAKWLRVEMVLNNSVAGLKLRSLHTVVVGIAIAKYAEVKPNKRLQSENEIWRKYEETARDALPESLTSVAGQMRVPIEAVTLTERDITALKDVSGIVYVLGQIDYGTGTLDYCGYIQPAQSNDSILCVEHNGPVPHPVFK
jgi:hypothetical protein